MQQRYRVELVEWFIKYWRQTEEQHLNLIKFLNKSPSESNSQILTLSLAVVVMDNEI